jgi:hypothetical protein
LLELSERFNLQPAVPTFSWGGGAAPGQDAPALYASDHDMFVFLMSKERSVDDTEALHRGIIITNSEVGGSALGLMWFLFRDICANHIIWGAKSVSELRLPHVGEVRSKWGKFVANVRSYMDSDTSEERAMLKATKALVLGDTKEEVLDRLFGMRMVPKRTLEAAYDATQVDLDGDPRTAWGFVQGLTRHSQTLPWADERTALDRVGRKVLALAF